MDRTDGNYCIAAIASALAVALIIRAIGGSGDQRRSKLSNTALRLIIIF